MSNKSETKARLVEIKLALVAKYENLVRITSSKPKKRSFQVRATRYRRQATELSR